VALAPPYRPCLIRDEQAGQAIEVEVWRVPTEHFGSFVAGIPVPLGIGKVQLRMVPGYPVLSVNLTASPGQKRSRHWVAGGIICGGKTYNGIGRGEMP